MSALQSTKFLASGWSTLRSESALLSVGRKLTKFWLFTVTEEEMKATVLKFTAILAVVMAFTASAYAQGLNANKSSFVVPFEFKVGDQVLAPGEYTVSAESEVIKIMSRDGKQHIAQLPKRKIGNGRETQSKLTFKRYGDDYYLAQVWLPDGIGREIKRSRSTATDVAQNATTVEVPGKGR